ncbi:sensor histidine kinase [Haloactinomyces albus]|uniref:histidine kinase n=1 Tax=Haloactinomyces albus TaxID=1352928 RepID=A0AAE3ZFR1_9ACTN|nr:nitrate- and nitrite sensing domain-containing protein [Haloactinomyces albus]MDR7302422.1 signal transduction histidine kinase [Haloactinomyces albus]
MTGTERATASESGRRTSRRGAIAQWRNWRIPVKLAAVVLVPVVFALTLGVFQIRDQVQRAESYEEIGSMLSARDRIQPLLTGLQEERTLAAAFLSGSGDLKALRAKAAAVTKAVSHAPEVLETVGEFSPTAASQFGELQKQLGQLKKLRKQVFTRSIGPVAAVQAYSDMVGALLGLERSVISDLGDPEVYGPVNALHELSTAEDEIRIQQALIGTALAQDNFSPALLDAVNDSRARLTSRLAEFRAAADPQQQRNYQRTVEVPAAAPREQSLDNILQLASSGDTEDITLTVSEWNAQSRALTSRTTQVRTGLSQHLQQVASGLYEDASDRAGFITVLLSAALMLAVVIIYAISRNLLGSLATLRRSALDAAQYQLPEAVSRVRQGEQTENSVTEVPVSTTEEIGQVARAFDEVNRQALYLAAEQASLRRGYSDSFINVSRRSQSLLERQLRLFEQLEQDEDDPDQLATLFRLDHLATRMRRNNENLMVLSGNDLARRFNQPAPVADVLRAAVSEIEHYPRVVVQSPPPARLVGYAGSDLVRLMAELFDNAANFSAPSTSVTVSSYQAGDGSITIDVLDHGIGMDDRELAEANALLASSEEPDMSTSRRLGMLVVNKLASRHGITVRMHGGEDFDGVRASVLVPAELVISSGTNTKLPTSDPSPSQSGLQPPGSQPSAPQPPPRGSAPHISDPPPADSPSAVSGQSLFEQNSGQPLPDRSPREPRRNGAVQHDTTSSRNNGSARRQVLEGGLPQRKPGGEFAGEAQPPFGPDAVSSHSWPSEPAPAEHAPAEQTFAESMFTDSAPVEPVPVEPVQEEPVRGLFEPPPKQGDAEEWSAPAVEQPIGQFDSTELPQPRHSYEQDLGPETQEMPPSFAEMATQWFQPSREDAYYQAEAQRQQVEDHHWPSSEDSVQSEPATPEPAPRDTGRRQRSGIGSGAAAWNFETDQAQQQADAIAHPEPASYTSSGLPRRTPRNQLASGATTVGKTEANTRSETRTGGNGIAEEAGRTRQDPEELRGRLSSFQRGARQGEPGMQPPAEHRAEPGSALQRGAASGTGTPGNEIASGSGLPRRQVSRAGTPDGDESAWNFATDRAQSAAEAAANHEPSEFTSAGLPRRTPRAQLAPGSAPSASSDQGGSDVRGQSAPDELRGRLSSFQQGVRRGRHSADE